MGNAGECRANDSFRFGLPQRNNLLLSLIVSARVAAVQREEPVGSSRRNHGIRHQADVRFDDQC
jgi:hypothetical protein